MFTTTLRYGGVSCSLGKAMGQYALVYNLALFGWLVHLRPLLTLEVVGHLYPSRLKRVRLPEALEGADFLTVCPALSTANCLCFFFSQFPPHSLPPETLLSVNPVRFHLNSKALKLASERWCTFITKRTFFSFTATEQTSEQGSDIQTKLLTLGQGWWGKKEEMQLSTLDKFSRAKPTPQSKARESVCEKAPGYRTESHRGCLFLYLF